MAFNPFHSFRKHQKAWFAALTILCMLTFVLCTGVGGDAASFVLRFFGSSGEPVARINGKKISTAQLGTLRLQRKVANDFMLQATARARYHQRLALLSKLDNKITPADDQRFMSYVVQNGPMMVSPEFFLMQIRDKKITNFTALEAYRKLLEKEGEIALLERSGGVRFFAGGDDEDDLLEFLLWRDEAERQGVRLVDDGVRELVEKETGGFLEDGDWQAIEDNLAREVKDVSPKFLLGALADEFRVRLVQTGYLGYRPGLGSRPEYPVTPDQFWLYFKEKCAQIDVEALPIPVEAFVDRVKGQPTTRALQKIFERGKDREKEPSSGEPAFRRPRRVRMQWVSAAANSSAYHQSKRYRETVKPQPALRQLLSVLNATPASVWLPTGIDYAVAAEYAEQPEGARARSDYRLPGLTEPNFVLPFYLAAAKKPDDALSPAEARERAQGAAAALGAVTGALGTDATMLTTAPFAYQVRLLAGAGKKEQKYVDAAVTKRAFAATTLTLSPYAPLPMFPGVNPALLPLSATWRAAESQDQYLPLGVVRDQLAERLDDKAARERIQADLTALKKKIDEYRPADKEDIERVRKPWVLDIIGQAAQKDGLEIEKMDKPEDSFAIPKNPQLAALRKAAGKEDKEFAKLFFDAENVYIPKALNLDTGSTGDQQPFLYWKTVIQEAQSPKSLSEVRGEVERWWRFDQARKEARKVADRVKKALQKGSSDDERRRLLKDLQAQLVKEYGSQLQQDLVTLIGVAPEQRTSSFRAGPPMYTAFRIPEGKFKYPQKTWPKQILTMQHPKTVAVVLENEPGTYFYVATRTSGPEARRGAFLEALRSHQDPQQRKFVRDKMWQECQKKYADDFRAKVVAQLKERAKFEDLRSAETREKARSKAKTQGRRKVPAPLE
jgi:hypothetical protein